MWTFKKTAKFLVPGECAHPWYCKSLSYFGSPHSPRSSSTRMYLLDLKNTDVGLTVTGKVSCVYRDIACNIRQKGKL